jgi:phage-related minor tail protein
MALDLGDLVARVSLNDDAFDKVLDRLPEKLRSSSAVSGVAALGIGTVIAGAVASGVNTAIDLDAANHKIAAQLGLSADEAARVGTMAGHLYSQNYGDSIDGVNDAILAVKSSIGDMANASDESVEATTAKVLNLAGAFDVDVQRAAQVAGQMVTTGFAQDSTGAIDLLTAALQKVPAALQGDLLDALDEYGPAFQAAGISGQDAMNLLVQSSEKGMFGIDKTGDAIKEFGIRATDMSTTSGAAFQAIGLNQQEMADKLLAGGDTAKSAFDQIVSGLAGIQDPATRANASIALFGTPLEDLNQSEIPAFLASLQGTQDALGDTTGAADAMGAQLNGGTAASLATLQRQFETLLGSLGTTLLPVLQAVLDWAMANPSVLQAVAAAIGILAVAFVALTVAMWAASLTPIMGTIALIVLGVAALVAAIIWLVANWDSVVQFITEIWGGFVNWITEVMDGFLSWWGGVWAGFLGFLTDTWNGAVSGLNDFVTGFVGFFLALPQMVLDALAGFVGMLADWGMSLLQGLATAVAIGILAVIYFFTQFPTDVMNALAGAAAWLVQTGTDIITGLNNGIVSMWQAVVAWLLALPGVILGFLAAAGTWLIQTGISLLTGLYQGVTSFWGTIVAWFLSMPGVVIGWLAAAGSWLVSAGSNLISGLYNGIQSFWNNVVSFFQNLPQTIMSVFGGIGSWLYSAGSDLISGLLDGIRSMAGSIGSFFLGLLPGWIVGPFKAALGIASPSKVFRGYGVNTVEGYLQGVDSMQGDLDARMRGLVKPLSADMTGSTLSGAGGAPGDAQGTMGSVVVDAQQTIHGDVYVVDLDALDKQARQRREDALALAGVTGVTGE